MCYTSSTTPDSAPRLAACRSSLRYPIINSPARIRAPVSRNTIGTPHRSATNPSRMEPKVLPRLPAVLYAPTAAPVVYRANGGPSAFMGYVWAQQNLERNSKACCPSRDRQGQYETGQSCPQQSSGTSRTRSTVGQQGPQGWRSGETTAEWDWLRAVLGLDESSNT